MESDARFYRRRASEEMAAASRAVTQAARERRMLLAGVFLDRLKSLENAKDIMAHAEVPAGRSAFHWSARCSLDA
jgi:hypothetical protein